jgi:hypothetical protein
MSFSEYDEKEKPQPNVRKCSRSYNGTGPMSRQAKAQGIIRRQIKFGEFHAEARRNGWILISD